ncbi:MAG: cation diffusion facilitator family transporter [Rhodospirillaceae bacterium]|nr:cation diffusion facilitator family transporter [Rhodospirillaceae bacterium]
MAEAASREARAESSGNAALMRRAAHASVAAAVLLIAIKLFAYLLTDSVSLLSSLLDSVLDAAASALTMLTVRQSLVPADREHRFGHGKAEPLGGLAQSAFIAGSAIFLLVESGNRMVKTQPLENTGIGIAVMAVSIVVSVALVGYQRHVIGRTRSVAIKADSLHYLSDLLINGVVIIALLLIEQTGWVLLDPIFAMGIALYIMWTSWRIAREMLDMLMDRELPDADRQRIRAIALSHPQVAAVHDLRTRAAGRHAFVQIHLEMDGDMPLKRAHEIADEVEGLISAEFPHAEVITHQDPVGVAEARLDARLRRAGGGGRR